MSGGLHFLADHHLQLPLRRKSRGRRWVPAGRARIYDLLVNPAYAGIYEYRPGAKKPPGHPSTEGGMPPAGMPDMPKVDRKVIVPKEVAAKWKAVKLTIEDKVKKSSKEYTVNVGGEQAVGIEDPDAAGEEVPQSPLVGRRRRLRWGVGGHAQGSFHFNSSAASSITRGTIAFNSFSICSGGIVRMSVESTTTSAIFPAVRLPRIFSAKLA